jgi:hypothetical protein
MEGVNMSKYEYKPGDQIHINIDALIDKDADIDHVIVVTDHEEDGTVFTLANERGELVALNGECCFIDHKVAGTEDLYDLVSVDGPEVIHFMMSGHDIGLM